MESLDAETKSYCGRLLSGINYPTAVSRRDDYDFVARDVDFLVHMLAGKTFCRFLHSDDVIVQMHAQTMFMARLTMCAEGLSAIIDDCKSMNA